MFPLGTHSLMVGESHHASDTTVKLPSNATGKLKVQVPCEYEGQRFRSYSFKDLGSLLGGGFLLRMLPKRGKPAKARRREIMQKESALREERRVS